MMRALSTASSGLEAQQTKLDVTANNIANASTPGFKKSRVEFADLMYQNLRAPGAANGADRIAPGGLQVGLGVRTVASHRSHSQGSLRQTGNQLDLAIEGRGFLSVTMPSGDLAYTRDGSLKLDAEGRLVTSEGNPLSGELTFPPDTQSITIGADGIVFARVSGSIEPVQIGQLELATFANPAGLESMGRNLFQSTAASGQAVLGTPGENGGGTILQGALELSNVKIVEEMIDLISGQRSYEINTRVVRAADEMLEQAANLK